MALTGMLADVTQAKVAGLLRQRQPDILDAADADQLAVYEERVRGAAVEVVLLVGSDPTPGPCRDLAVEAIALQTASEIEYAEYPEQQVQGDVGRGYHLHQRYLELLKVLQRLIDAGTVAPGDGATPTVPPPLSSFPPPLPDLVLTEPWEDLPRC